MGFRYTKHYTRDQARAILPEVRRWLTALREVRDRLRELDRRLAQMLGEGRDCGGRTVENSIRGVAEMQGLLSHFQKREIQVKDLDRGLIDFPAILAGREVYLCWEEGEADIEYWHDLDTGYSGRHPI